MTGTAWLTAFDNIEPPLLALRRLAAELPTDAEGLLAIAHSLGLLPLTATTARAFRDSLPGRFASTHEFGAVTDTVVGHLDRHLLAAARAGHPRLIAPESIPTEAIYYLPQPQGRPGPETALVRVDAVPEGHPLHEQVEGFDFAELASNQWGDLAPHVVLGPAFHGFDDRRPPLWAAVETCRRLTADLAGQKRRERAQAEREAEAREAAEAERRREKADREANNPAVLRAELDRLRNLVEAKQ